ncbi:hypothetical protein [Chitinophaga nivalis]|uniref:Uncharacterized protein n=1 Tax=Chitinophaga nivalis TaxID=2991709 RepID=A0ABT3IQR3_9BACT|nr:hypothetical protein [Chitinophaga nivalis]MCW3464020.1 hypothetical protein [Chitinophaga nivalis]MCW3486290.1 hypothetical protein [Chitinophaga nivalis]
MIRKFEIIKLFDHHNRGQFIVTRQIDFKEAIEIKEGALLNGIPVYHYLEMYPISNEQGKSQFDIYVFRPALERFPKGYFQVGQITELVTQEISQAIVSTPLEEHIREAIPKLLEMARELTWNNISDNCKFIVTAIKDSQDSFHEQRKLNKKTNDNKVPVTLTELIPTLESLYNFFYEINLHIYKATKSMTIIDFRYYAKSFPDGNYQEKLHKPPMFHCKVAIPPWLSEKKEKFDINWEHYKWLNRLQLIRMKLKLKPWKRTI